MRNNFFKGGIALAFLSLCLAAAGGYVALAAFPEASAAAASRPDGLPEGFVKAFIEGRFERQPLVPLWAMLIAALYSLAGSILILLFFEKTQVPEIIFLGFFVISLSFECARIIIPLKVIFSFSDMYLVSASRLLLFGRFFGLFSLFAAGVYAAGLDMQKQQNVFFILVFAALIIALNIPLDALLWDSSFKMQSASASMLMVVEAGVIIVTVVTFFISAYTRGSKTYLHAGLGSLIAYLGRHILLNSDTWLSLPFAFLFLAGGTWIISARLHREYLWM